MDVSLGVRSSSPASSDGSVDELGDSATSFVDAVLDGTPRVVVFVALLALGWVLSRVLRWGVRAVLRRHRTESFAVVMSKVIGWFLLAVVALAAVAITFPSVQPVDVLSSLGFFSIAVGFAFKDILENSLAGVLLLFRQPFQAGDQIRVGDHAGTVVRITIRETQLTTFNGELVVVPNSDVYKSAIVVPTHHPQRRQEFVVGIAYENDAAEAVEVIERALIRVDGVSSIPPPEAYVDKLSASTVDIVATFWADPHMAPGLRTRTAAITEVKRRLDAADIEMPADIVVLQATPSLRAAIHDDKVVTPGGGVRPTGGSSC